MSLSPSQHAQFDALEVQMATDPRRVALEVRHDFLPGLYIRTLFIPKGTMLTGEEHKTRHAWVMRKGVLAVVGMGVLRAPLCGIGEPGTRRVAYAWEDTVWSTMHVTHLTDPDMIREKIINVRHHLDGLAPAESEFKAILAGSTP